MKQFILAFLRKENKQWPTFKGFTQEKGPLLLIST